MCRGRGCQTIDGKAWLQQNNSDLLVADKLVEMGADRNDIIMDTDTAYIVINPISL